MTKDKGDWKISKVLEVKEVKVQGGIQRKFRIDWAPTLSTAAEVGKSDKELLNMLVTYKVLGPVDCPENKDKKDCKEMVWEVEGTKGVDGKVTLYRIFYDELLRDHPRELCEYFSQFVQHMSPGETSSESVQHLEGRLYKCYTGLLSLITSFEKGSTADITAHLRSVEQDLQELREVVKQVPEISSEEEFQFRKIRDLYSLDKSNKKMTSSQASDPTLSTQEPNPSESQRNEKTIICKHCSSVVILPNVGVWNDLAVELPLARQQKGVNTQKESISGFWAIRDMMAFENVGFTNAVDGVSYLSCADCEYGPIGFVDNNTKLHLITPARLETKD